MTLKDKLGLSAIKKVYISRLIGIGYPLYFVFFDSRRPNTTLTSMECHRKEFATVVPFQRGERLRLTNIIEIERFTERPDAVYIRIDISGRFSQMPVRESTGILCEEMNIEDFKSAAAISDRVVRTRAQRRKLLGGGNDIKYVKLINCRLDKRGDWVEFNFKSVVTPDGKAKYKTNPKSNFSLVPNPSGVYLITLRMDGFFTWLFGTAVEGQKITPKDVRDAMRVCAIKMWDNDPSMYWQGFAYNLSQLDASIYTVTIPPKRWNVIHGGEFFLSKHMAALVKNISFFLNPMTSKLITGLRQLKILDVDYFFKK